MKLIVKKQAPLLAYLYENLDMPKKRIKKYLTNGSIYINNEIIDTFKKIIGEERVYLKTI